MYLKMKNLLGKRVLVAREVFAEKTIKEQQIAEEWIEGKILGVHAMGLPTSGNDNGLQVGFFSYHFTIATKYRIVMTSCMNVKLKKPWYAFWRKW